MYFSEYFPEKIFDAICKQITCAPNFSQKKLEKPGVKVTKVVTDDGIVEKKTKLYVVKITLFTPENEMQVISLDEANKLAKRRNLKLVKVAEKDPKSDRALYKLMTAAEYVKKNQADKDKKSEKLVSISSRIADHDLQSKINHILKWIAKDHNVRVVISSSSDNLATAEEVFGKISENIASVGRVVQKISKNSEIKFQVMPPKKTKKSDKTETDNKEAKEVNE